ncbi:MAG TPA: SpoIIE family protein phosphatase [Gemmatimonadaceae bacterium]|jgi:serine phosphatase RsbU (regulator of sigma subunit)|nr:SpoIIE family protein phosphatase [Gemmatimonadaceae bacterium]
MIRTGHMDTLGHLLLLYAGLVLINTALSAALWLGGRAPLHRDLLLVWGSTLLSYVLQGALTRNALVMTYAYASVFLVNLALASLVARSVGLPLRWRRFAWIVVGAEALSTAIWLTGARFTMVALPVAIAVSLPALVVGGRVVRAWRRASIAMRALVISCVLFSLHNIDWAFLRDRPGTATFGFTVATLIIFALSISALAVVLESVTERQTRIDAEVEVARHIQTRLLPAAVAVPGFDVAAHTRPTEVVGGDYYDVHATPDGTWFFLGDVTGHGLGAGLVTLMAQSTVTSIIEARPSVRPRELNYIANRVLAANLARLGEDRHLSFVALHRVSTDEFAVSGSHDTAFIYRARNGAVESIELSHFPFGLGFSPNLDMDAFSEETIRLGPGDVLFIGSDGITEAAREGDVTKGMFGEDGLVEFITDHAGHSATEMRAALLRRLEAFTGGAYSDDVSFVILRALGTSELTPITGPERVVTAGGRRA